jgi:hypothetical protein
MFSHPRTTNVHNYRIKNLKSLPELVLFLQTIYCTYCLLYGDLQRLEMSKQTKQRFHMDRFNLKKLNEVKGKEQYRVQISNRFADS